jgi:hypothetical protein
LKKQRQAKNGYEPPRRYQQRFMLVRDSPHGPYQFASPLWSMLTERPTQKARARFP